MKPCTETRRLQPFLDGELGVEESARVRRHAETCVTCARELALYQRLFVALRPTPVPDPGPALTERILDRVLPSRLRRRWVTAIGWSYTAASATCTFMFVSWIVRPETHVWIATQLGVALERVVRIGWYALDGVVFLWLHLALLVQLFWSLGPRLAPLLRALTLPLSHPPVVAALWAALVSTVLLVWWLRSRTEPKTEKARHVEILGF